MSSRIELQEKLEELLGSEEVYFQSPVNKSMVYPAIIYDINDIDINHADNNPYFMNIEYNVQLITPDPDDPVIFKLAYLPKCMHDRAFVSDGLHHYSFNLYF